jgi:hypothetical protein
MVFSIHGMFKIDSVCILNSVRFRDSFCRFKMKTGIYRFNYLGLFKLKMSKRCGTHFCPNDKNALRVDDHGSRHTLSVKIMSSAKNQIRLTYIKISRKKRRIQPKRENIKIPMFLKSYEAMYKKNENVYYTPRILYTINYGSWSCIWKKKFPSTVEPMSTWNMSTLKGRVLACSGLRVAGKKLPGEEPC